MSINGTLNTNNTITSTSTISGGYIQSSGDVKANSSLVSANDIAIGRHFYNKWNKGDSTCAIYEQGNAFFARRSGSNGAFIIADTGNVEHRASITTRGLTVIPGGASETGGTGRIQAYYMYNTNGGGRIDVH